MQNINPGDVITFTEYDVSQLSGRKRIRQRMENMIVAAVVCPGETLSRDRIDEYYGEYLTDSERMALSISQATRLVLKTDDNETVCVNVVEDFLKTGLQEIEIGARSVPEQTAEPSYLQFLNMFGSQ